jgi:uncharacterized membrane protein YbhN (UPF0104 family)
VFKVVVTGALLVVVAHRVDGAEVVRTLAEMGWLGAVASAGLSFLAVAVSSWRWHRVLAHLGEHVPFRMTLGDTLVGTTYNLLLPTSVGGDVARGLRCAKRAEFAEHAWASVAFERILGLLSLVLVSSVGLISMASPTLRSLSWAAGAMAVGLILTLVLLPIPIRWVSRFRVVKVRKLGSTLAGLAQAFSGPLARPYPLIETLAWSVAYQVVALGLLLPAGAHWGEPALLSAVFLGVPIALVASILPVSIGGFGLRESLFIVVLAPFGLDANQALALSLVWVVSNVFVAVLGLAVIVGEKT